MTTYFNAGIKTVTDSALWLHRSMVEVPVFRNVYVFIIDNVAKPGWETACKVKNIEVPSLQTMKPVLYKYRYVLGGVGLVLTFFAVKAYWESDPD